MTAWPHKRAYADQRRLTHTCDKQLALHQTAPCRAPHVRRPEGYLNLLQCLHQLPQHLRKGAEPKPPQQRKRPLPNRPQRQKKLPRRNRQYAHAQKRRNPKRQHRCQNQTQRLSPTVWMSHLASRIRSSLFARQSQRSLPSVAAPASCPQTTSRCSMARKMGYLGKLFVILVRR